MAAIDESLFVETHERFAHGPRELGGESVRGARPVAGASNCLELLENGAASLAYERFRPPNELGATDVEACLPLCGPEQLLDDILRRDSGMVRPGYPERLVAGHAAPADQHILRNVVEPVPHVQHGRDVRRRDDDRERLAIPADPPGAFRARRKDPGGAPALVDRPLDRRRVELGWDGVEGGACHACSLSRALRVLKALRALGALRALNCFPLSAPSAPGALSALSSVGPWRLLGAEWIRDVVRFRDARRSDRASVGPATTLRLT